MSSNEIILVATMAFVACPLAGICGAVWYRLYSVRDAVKQCKEEADGWRDEFFKAYRQMHAARDRMIHHRDRCRQLRKELRDAKGGDKLKVRT